MLNHLPIKKMIRHLVQIIGKTFKLNHLMLMLIQRNKKKSNRRKEMRQQMMKEMKEKKRMTNERLISSVGYNY